MRIRTPVLIPLLMLLVATGTLIIGIAMGDTMKSYKEENDISEAETIHVTATLNVQLVDPGNSTAIPNVNMYLKSLLEEHSTICGRYVGEHNAVKITDENGMVSFTSGYNLTEGDAIRFQVSSVSFRQGAHILYISYDDAEKEKEDNSGAVTITETMIVDYTEDSFLPETYPGTPLRSWTSQQR